MLCTSATMSCRPRSIYQWSLLFSAFKRVIKSKLRWPFEMTLPHILHNILELIALPLFSLWYFSDIFEEKSDCTAGFFFFWNSLQEMMSYVYWKTVGYNNISSFKVFYVCRLEVQPHSRCIDIFHRLCRKRFFSRSFVSGPWCAIWHCALGYAEKCWPFFLMSIWKPAGFASVKGIGRYDNNLISVPQNCRKNILVQTEVARAAND